MIALRAQCVAALRASLDAGNIPPTVLGYNLRLETGKQRLAISYRRAHRGRRDFLRPLNRAHLVFDWAAWKHLNHQLDCPFHPKRLTRPTTFHTLDEYDRPPMADFSTGTMWIFAPALTDQRRL